MKIRLKSRNLYFKLIFELIFTFILEWCLKTTQQLYDKYEAFPITVYHWLRYLLPYALDV